MQVALTAVPRTVKLPAGAVRPAKRGMMQLGPTKAGWVPVLATASNDAEGERAFFDACTTRIENADLLMTKLVDNAEPHSGEIVTFTPAFVAASPAFVAI